MDRVYCNTSDAVFYSCDYGSRFLGCCANTSPNEVCANGCSSGSDLEVAAFESMYYENISPQSCDSTDGDEEAEWYTCLITSPPFLGCCTSNPCTQDGCPSNDLVAARLSTNETSKESFSAITFRDPSTSHDRTGAIIGSVLGGLVFIVVVQCALFWYWRRVRRSDVKKLDGKQSPQGTILPPRPRTNNAPILLISSIQIPILPCHLWCRNHQMMQKTSRVLSMNSTQIPCPSANSVHQLRHARCTSL